MKRLYRYTVMFSAILSVCGLTVVGCSHSRERIISPRPIAASQPVPVNEVDDAAIWIHPTDPALSLLILANELHGLEIHDMDGLLRKHIDRELHPNNVDLIYSYPTDNGPLDLVVASCFSQATPGVKVWRVDPEKRKLYDATAGAILPVFGGVEPLGLCTYHSPKDGSCYFFVTHRDGRIEQHMLIAEPGDHVSSKKVREFKLATKTEGCVADEDRGVVYFAEEDTGVWRFNAEPGEPENRKCVIRAGEHGLTPDVEGLALYAAPSERGYLLVVGQGPKGGESIINVYERSHDNDFVLSIKPSAKPYGPIERASGIAVTNAATIPALPAGALVVNDHINPSASEDFKIFDWRDIAKQGHLIVDTTWTRRPITSLAKSANLP
ncbi:MAG: phytase [Phycisphaerales bacterium]|nr:phytase [Phycisphaerales bacterium]